MRKIFCAVLLFIIMLCGCAESSTSVLARNISFLAKITDNKTVITAECEIDEAGVLTAKIIEPEALEGLEIIYGTERHYVYKGMEAAADSAKTDILAVLPRLDGMRAEWKRDELQISTEAGSQLCTVSVAASGLPIKIICGSTEAQLMNMKINGGNATA